MIKKDGIKQMTEASVLLENVDFNMLITSSHYINSQSGISKPLLHDHVFYELFLCKRGELCIKTAEEDIILNSGDIAIIPPSKTHALSRVSDYTEGITIPFNCKMVNRIFNVDIYKRLNTIINNEAHVFNNCEDRVYEIERLIKKSLEDGAEDFLTALGFIEILLTLGKAKPKQRDNGFKKNEAVSDDIEKMMKLDSMISSRYHQKMTASDFARELFISTRQLDRIAIKRYGKSIHKLIVDNRFSFAEQLILTTDLTVEEVALRAGFSSSAGLYKEFKRRKGMTPSVYRTSRAL